MTYKQMNERDGTLSLMIQRINDDGSISFIPNDPQNVDRQAYETWLSKGNVPEPPAP